MAEERYQIPASPEYSEDIRRLQDTDPASASQVFNPLIQRLVENIAAVKRQTDSGAGEKGQPGGIATLDGSGKVPAEQLPSLAPFAAGPSAPADRTKLWIDTTANTGGLKYWNGSAWVPVPVAYT